MIKTDRMLHWSESELEGSLSINVNDHWTKHYYRLKNNVLYSFSSESDEKPLETYYLQDYTIEEYIMDKRVPTITLSGPLGQYFIKAETESDHVRWLSVLKSNQDQCNSPTRFNTPRKSDWSVRPSLGNLPSYSSIKTKNTSNSSFFITKKHTTNNMVMGTRAQRTPTFPQSPDLFFDLNNFILPPLPPIPKDGKKFTLPDEDEYDDRYGAYRSMSQGYVSHSSPLKIRGLSAPAISEIRSEESPEKRDYIENRNEFFFENDSFRDLEQELDSFTLSMDEPSNNNNIIAVNLPPEVDIVIEGTETVSRRVVVNEEKIMKRLSVEIPDSLQSSRSLLLLNSIIDEMTPEDDEVEHDTKTVKRSSSAWLSTHTSAQSEQRRLSSSGRHRIVTPTSAERKKLEQYKLKKLHDTYVSKGDPNDQYVINSKSIAKGSLGEVFFATTHDKSVQVAIKKLQLYRNGRNRLPFILREIDIIATSAHQNIVKYIESYQIEGELWVVMEYMSAGSLYEIVKLYPRGIRLKESACAYVFHEVLQAVSFLHERKRIHRDIKVDNILLSRSGSVKLADFGTAVQLTFQRLRRNTIAGTPYYMAPELISRADYGEKVDIWSIGISVVELMSGTPPINTLDPMKALEVITTKGIVGLKTKKYSEDICHFVNERCLQIDPTKRADAKELIEHPWIATKVTKEEFAKVLNNMRLSPDLLEMTGGYEGLDPDDSGCTIL